MIIICILICTIIIFIKLPNISFKKRGELLLIIILLKLINNNKFLFVGVVGGGVVVGWDFFILIKMAL